MNSEVIFRVHVYKYHIDYQQYEVPYIVLEDKNTGIPIKIMDISIYLSDVSGGAMSYKNSQEYVRTICELLNYIFIYKNYGLDNLSEITKGIIEDFLNDQCNRLNKQGRRVSKRTIDIKANHIITMIYSLHGFHKNYFNFIKPDDIATYDKVFVDRERRTVIHSKLIYGSLLNDHRESNAYKSLERDIPINLLKKFVLAARAFDPELEFAIVLASYGGLREGEICNVRRNGSCYGYGISFVKKNSRIDSITINLKKVMVLREDGKSQGNIKRLREAVVPACFVEIVNEAYQRHLKLIEGKSCSKTMPMFLNERKTNGIYECMSISGYRNRIKRLLYEHILPGLMESSDINEKLFYTNMLTKTFGAHAFRHWYSVALVLEGYDETQLQIARGDNSIQASRDYLRNKGELMRLYKKAATDLQDIIGGKRHE